VTPRLLNRSGAAMLAVATTTLLTLATASPAHSADDTRPFFYEPPNTLPANNGDVIRSEPSVYYLDPGKTIKVDAIVHRVMYRSTDGFGQPIAMTGTVITPKTPWLGKGERPVIGYAPGTQGLADTCAPSRQLANGTEYEGLFISGLLARGYAVTMTDYEGLGTPGTHTYVNRAVSGNATLDSVRAAQRLPEAQVPVHGPVSITGYSQGGGAAAAAAELAPEYAPELDIKGVVAGAAPSDLQKVAEKIDGSLYVAFLGYATAGLAAGYDIDTDPYLNDKGEQFIADSGKYCTVEALARHPFQQSKDYTADGRPITEYLRDPRWRAVVDEQKIGNRPPEDPVLITHSTLDDVIPFELGEKLASDWCSQGADVQFAPNPGPTHVGGAVAGFPVMFSWLEARFAGLPTTSTCPASEKTDSP
jgi:pimeloyl-ACP methyl ester carboxylesterase